MRAKSDSACGPGTSAPLKPRAARITVKNTTTPAVTASSARTADAAGALARCIVPARRAHTLAHPDQGGPDQEASGQPPAQRRRRRAIDDVHPRPQHRGGDGQQRQIEDGNLAQPPLLFPRRPSEYSQQPRGQHRQQQPRPRPDGSRQCYRSSARRPLGENPRPGHRARQHHLPDHQRGQRHPVEAGPGCRQQNARWSFDHDAPCQDPSKGQQSNADAVGLQTAGVGEPSTRIGEEGHGADHRAHQPGLEGGEPARTAPVQRRHEECQAQCERGEGVAEIVRKVARGPGDQQRQRPSEQADAPEGVRERSEPAGQRRRRDSERQRLDGQHHSPLFKLLRIGPRQGPQRTRNEQRAGDVGQRGAAPAHTCEKARQQAHAMNARRGQRPIAAVSGGDHQRRRRRGQAGPSEAARLIHLPGPVQPGGQGRQDHGDACQDGAAVGARQQRNSAPAASFSTDSFPVAR